MTLDEAKKILLARRPERPRRTEDRQLQCAIDTVLPVLDVYKKIIEEIKIEVRINE